MGKVNSLSLCKRFMSLVASVMLMFSSLPGLAEDSEVEITTDTKIENQINDNQAGVVEEQVTVNKVMQDIEKIKEDYTPKISAKEHFSLLESLSGGFRELIPLYLSLNGYYNNVGLIAQLIDSGYVTKDELYNCNNSVYFLGDVMFFNSLCKTSDELLDVKLLFSSEKEYESFQEIYGVIDNYKAKNENKSLDSESLIALMEKIESIYNESVLDDRQLYNLIHEARGAVAMVIHSNSKKFVSKVNTKKNFIEYHWVPKDGVPFDWHEKDTLRAVLGAAIRLNEMCEEIKKKIEVSNEELDAALSEYRKMNAVMLAMESDEVVEEHKESSNSK